MAVALVTWLWLWLHGYGFGYMAMAFQSVIIGADEAAELLPHLQQAVTRAQEAAQRRLSN